ncbi:MAG: GAF domain-containing protein [Actinomycetota bacterium]|nr:GAF domain-containing protein [Actinomycetota bacterium]
MSADLRAAVAAGVLGAEESHRALLQATVEVARAIFFAKASSVFLYDEETDELVFEAVAGEGSDTLIGHRLPSSTGIAGWVLVTRQPLVLEDVTQDPRWGGREIAERTGYVPKGLMAVPLLHEEDAVGVLNVLDRPQQTRFSLEEMELLGLFGNQAAIALDLLRKARRARAVLDDAGTDAALLARVAENLETLDGNRRAAGVELLRSLEALFKR